MDFEELNGYLIKPANGSRYKDGLGIRKKKIEHQ